MFVRYNPTSGLVEFADTPENPATTFSPLKVEFGSQFRLNAILQPSNISSNQNNYNPTGLGAASLLHLSATTAVDITGIVAQPDGTILIILNANVNNITLKGLDSNSDSDNQFVLDRFGDVILGFIDSISLIYYGGKWRQFNSGGVIPWAKVSKSGSSLADLATRSAGDLSSGTLDNARINGYTNYNPAWVTSGVAPSIGDGSLVGHYTQIGKLVHYVAQLTFGSTTSMGTGFQFIGLPVTATGGNVGSSVIGAWYAANTGVATYAGHTFLSSNPDYALCIVGISTTDFLSDSNLFTFGNGDVLILSGTYRAA